MNKLILRNDAIELLKKFNPDKFEMTHYLMSGAVMKEVAKKLGEDVEHWELLGLLHDVDWTITKENPSTHLSLAPKILREAGFDEDFIETIVSHGYGFKEIPSLSDKKRTKKVEFALAASETLTGIIYAYALMRGRRVTGMEVKGLKKKFKDKKFAAGCEREIIKEIENTGLSLNDLFEAGIKGAQEIKDEIDLE